MTDASRPLDDYWSQIMATGPCFACQRVFTFAPQTVCSVPIEPGTGVTPDVDPRTGKLLARPRDVETVKQPVCPRCVRLINPQREANGLDPWPVADDERQPFELPRDDEPRAGEFTRAQRDDEQTRELRRAARERGM